MRVTRNLQFSRCKYDDANTSMARSRIDVKFPEYESRLSRIGCMRTSATGDEGEIEKEKSAGRGRRLRPGGLKGANIVNGAPTSTANQSSLQVRESYNQLPTGLARKASPDTPDDIGIVTVDFSAIGSNEVGNARDLCLISSKAEQINSIHGVRRNRLKSHDLPLERFAFATMEDTQTGGGQRSGASRD
ncbi:unnamed protein product [Nesidiocoris tenuis]|uniref:Uncharacterized protein n=1 Tax=Nesidiocoris tenuis TaxID=355587 RepID=A0A6H5GYL9_9HEMI|nr:unnamed protein product [Nesidiocoris tenuis]